MNETVQHHLGSGHDYTVGQLARLSGISVRTLHHYDAIGLLKPALVRDNGYRVYRDGELLRLQEILFYREIGMELSEIAKLLDGSSDPLKRLTHHRTKLVQQAERQKKMIALLDTTLAHLKGEQIMAARDLYEPFSKAKQAEYEAWLIETYGPDMADAIRTSKHAIAEIPEGIKGAMKRLESLETRLVEAFADGIPSASEHIHSVLEEHRALMSELWGKPCPPEGYNGLADLYLSHPDFVARYERLAPQFSRWLPEAMKAHAVRLKGTT